MRVLVSRVCAAPMCATFGTYDEVPSASHSAKHRLWPDHRCSPGTVCRWPVPRPCLRYTCSQQIGLGLLSKSFERERECYQNDRSIDLPSTYLNFSALHADLYASEWTLISLHFYPVLRRPLGSLASVWVSWLSVSSPHGFPSCSCASISSLRTVLVWMSLSWYGSVHLTFWLYPKALPCL